MKLTAGALLPALCLAASATPPTAFTYDPRSKPSLFGTLDPVAARLVLAQRIGVEDYHNADLERKGVIEAINEYGIQQSLLAAKETAVKKALIFLEGDSRPRAEWTILKEQAGFQILPSPNALASRDLFIDLARQSDPRGDLHSTDVEVFAQLAESRETLRSDNMFYVAKSADDFEAVFSRLVKEGSWSITALSVPADDLTITHEKGEWGTYEMPHSQSTLKKRQRQEEPLTETSEHKPVHSTSMPFTPLADSKRLEGIIASCYPSKSACNEATKNCTGHGACKLKYHDEGARGNKDCFSCQCAAVKSSDGKSTTQYAGPACQKKDYSVEFWLIALFTIAMMFLVGFAIGQIWEMGDQELPSVIGAGVSGPSARK